ncbi:glycosyltransferase family 4 protein [Dyadobacter sp. Leaf189]|uniref:glycosyltransferase family 4 protein n=1 Tax=Dyadobacter sp. Leaf189 TaxID=1736295 RepID=UPI0006FF9882|nr:glycosyltransferase family 4 protein [Dyadobacter sp. Leaf189]KQS32763.1 glycosyl transferase family 1 [Dyadobacter sp. Leaf189]
MHILLIHQFFLRDNEGGGSRWNEMSRIWIGQGHQVTVLAGNVHYMNSENAAGERWFTDTTNAVGVRVIRCFVSEKYHSGFSGRLIGYFSFVFSAIFGGIFYARERYDAVLVTSPPLFIGFSGWLLARLKRISFILEIRDLWPESAIGAGLLTSKRLIKVSYAFEQFLYKRAKIINVLTPAFREVLINQKNVERERICFIPNAADFSLSEKINSNFDNVAFRQKLGLKDAFVLIYVGAHGVANALMQLIDAAELLTDTHAHFLLIGDGAEKQMLMNEVARRSLKNVTFVSQVSKEKVFEYILAADAGLSVLKRAEIFKTVYSNKTFDYFSCKKTVLIGIDGISRELVEQADAGTFVEPECPEDLAAKVRFYLKNPELAEQQGNNGYLYARQHFDRTQLADKYLSLIQKLIEANDS